jgi:hypothetical protein
MNKSGGDTGGTGDTKLLTQLFIGARDKYLHNDLDWFIFLFFFSFQRNKLLKPVLTTQRLPFTVWTKVRTKAVGRAPGGRNESIHGHLLVSKLLHLHDHLAISRGFTTFGISILYYFVGIFFMWDFLLLKYLFQNASGRASTTLQANFIYFSCTFCSVERH